MPISSLSFWTFCCSRAGRCFSLSCCFLFAGDMKDRGYMLLFVKRYIKHTHPTPPPKVYFLRHFGFQVAKLMLKSTWAFKLSRLGFSRYPHASWSFKTCLLFQIVICSQWLPTPDWWLLLKKLSLPKELVHSCRFLQLAVDTSVEVGKLCGNCKSWGNIFAK